MKKLAVATLLLLAFASISAAQQCDCTIFPYNPPSCSGQCINKLVFKANEAELRFFFKLNKGIAEKIANLNEIFKREGKTPSRQDYLKALTKPEQTAFNKSFNSLDKSKIQYLEIPTDTKVRKETREGLDKVYTNIDKLDNSRESALN